MMQQEIDFDQALIPGIYKDRTNCRIFYAHIAAVFITLLLILVITITTATTIIEVHNTAMKSGTIIEDMNELVPQAKLGLKIIKVLCDDKNFTTFYPKYADVIC